MTIDIVNYKSNRYRIKCLREQYESKHVIPYLGAATSIPVFPQWRNLLEELAKRNGMYKDVENELLNYQLIKAASILSKNIEDVSGRNHFKKLLLETLDDCMIEDAELKKTLLYKSKDILNCDRIFTTNYDNIAKHVFKDHYVVDEVFDLKRNTITDLFESSIRKNKKCIFKLHGSINIENSIVIDENDYDRIYNNPKFIDIFKDCYKQDSLLFVGCSLEDDRTMEILRKIKEDKQVQKTHFAILEWDDNNKEKMLKRESDLMEIYNITPIWYPIREYDYVIKILKLLKQNTKPKPKPNPVPIKERNMVKDHIEKKVLHVKAMLSYKTRLNDILETNYIAPNILDLNSKDIISDDAEFLRVIDKRPKDLSAILLYGSSGMGKSIYLGHLYNQLNNRSKKFNPLIYFNRNAIKYFLNPKTHKSILTEENSKLPNVLTSVLKNKYNTDKKAKMPTLVFIDSYEEVFRGFTDDEIETVFSKISAIKGYLLIGCRKSYPTFEKLEIIRQYELKEWKYNKIEAFFTGFFKNKQDVMELEDYLEHHIPTMQLMQTPINAFMMCHIFADLKNESNLQINNIFELYNTFYDLRVDSEIKKYMGKCNEIEKKDVKRLVFKYHLEIARFLYSQTKNSAQLYVNDLRIENDIIQNIVGTILVYDNNSNVIKNFIHDSFIDFILVKNALRSVIELNDLSFLTVLFRHFDIKFFEAGVQSLNEEEYIKYRDNLETLYYNMLNPSGKRNYKNEYDSSIKADSDIKKMINELKLENGYSINEIKNKLVYCYGKIKGTTLRKQKNLLEYIYFNETDISVRICAAISAIKHGVGVNENLDSVSEIEHDFVNKILNESKWGLTFRSIALFFWGDFNKSFSSTYDNGDYSWDKVKIRTLNRLSSYGVDGKSRKCVRTKAIDLLLLYIFFESREWREFTKEVYDQVFDCKNHLVELESNKTTVLNMLAKYDVIVDDKFPQYKYALG